MNDDIGFIVSHNLDLLIDKLSEYGVVISIDEIHYIIMSREEWIYINSDIIYPNEDIPDMFGVYRGYSGGDIHSDIVTTQIDHMSKSKQRRAKQLLNIFKDTLINILRDINSLTDPKLYGDVII